MKNLLNRVRHGTHPRDPEKVNKNVAQNAKQRDLYYPNLELGEADASELQASQHSESNEKHHTEVTAVADQRDRDHPRLSTRRARA